VRGTLVGLVAIYAVQCTIRSPGSREHTQREPPVKVMCAYFCCDILYLSIRDMAPKEKAFIKSQLFIYFVKTMQYNIICISQCKKANAVIIVLNDRRKILKKSNQSLPIVVDNMKIN